MGKKNNLAEITFKKGRRLIFRNRNNLDIIKGSYVIVQADRGEDMGMVTNMGDLVKIRRGKGDTRNIIRLAREKDTEKLKKNREKETQAYKVCGEKIESHKLDMKLVDVEMQFDNSKITFYFTASKRVDFRELVKELASMYKTRIELRQIGARDEAKRIDGFGICGRRLCCSGFLNEFEQVTVQMAKDQKLSLNPSKISGSCGRLLCCLRYEESTYSNVYRKFPELSSRVKAHGKEGRLVDINVFNKKGLVLFREENSQEWYGPDEITEISDNNKQKKDDKK